RWWCGSASALAFPDLIQQVVGLHRPATVGNQAEHARADRCQPQSALLAGNFNRRHETGGIVDVVLGIDAGMT
ncbi:MAG: hypothetical protein JWL98_1036, partial [Xanthomonadaceae bacterium]|nr:hypothetical protein [Xanthomonadaceae bacterium]